MSIASNHRNEQKLTHIKSNTTRLILFYQEAAKRMLENFTNHAVVLRLLLDIIFARQNLSKLT